MVVKGKKCLLMEEVNGNGKNAGKWEKVFIGESVKLIKLNNVRLLYALATSI
jgi:hypothetical protein